MAVGLVFLIQHSILTSVLSTNATPLFYQMLSVQSI